MKVSLRLFYLIIGIFAFQEGIYAQYWQSLNPGAGGRVQGVSCDPTTPGRMFVASDMEGFYYSDDYGTSWNWSGKDLPTTFMLKVEGRGDNFYVGHAKGLSVSTDKGSTFSLVAATEDKTIGVIEVDPTNTNNIYAGVNWRGNDGHLNHYPQTTTGTKEIYYSHDGGATWNTSSWANFATGDPRVQTIQVLPTNSNHVYISTSDGLYKSTNKGGSWTKISAPSGVDGEYCWGADFTSDGQWMYALYRKNGYTNLYAQKLAEGVWQDLGKGNWDSHQMWEPLVYQDGNTSKHFVLVSQRDQNPNEGLFEAEIDISGNTATASFSIILNHNGGAASVTYDIGWNYYMANCRNKTYYPSSWSNTGYSRGVFTQVQQSYFTGDAATGNMDWRIVSTGYVKEQNGLRFYKSRGTASTFTYDVAVHQNYIIQGQADNLALESWDNGGSWVQTRTNFNVRDGHAVHVIPTDPAIVLMDAAAGYGGGNPSANSDLLYKVLDENNPDHNWQRLAWGTAAADKKGLPENRIWQFHADPNDYKRLYVVTHTGLYLCDDIVSLINTGAPYFRKIHTGTALGAGFSVNPANTNEVYYKDNSGCHKGIRDASGNYSWTQMTRSTGQTSNLNWGGVATVNKGNNTYVYTYERYKGIVRADNGATQFGTTAVLWDADLFNYLDQPDWYDPAHHIIQTNAMYADGNTLYITFHVWEDVRWGYGIVKGTVNDNGSVTWQDWTSDLHYSTAKQIKKYDGKLYIATQGAGLLARKLNGGTADALPSIDEGDWVQPEEEPQTPEGNGDCGATSPSGKPNPPCGVWAEVTSSTSVILHWNDNSDNEDYFDIQSQIPGESFKASGMPDGAENTNSVAITGLVENSKYTFRIKATNTNGGSNWVSADQINLADGGGSSSPVAVTGVTLSSSVTSLEVNETVQLNVTVSPSNATNQNVTYTSSNTSVVSVNSNGLVTALAEGTANITVTTEDGGFTSQVAITVTAATSNPPQGNGDCSATSAGGKPNPPCGVWAEVTSSTSVTLHWNDNSDNEDYFDIQAQVPGESFKASGMPDGAENTNSVVITGLVENSKYTFRIKSANSNGGSNWVSTDQVTLSGQTPPSSVAVTGVSLSPSTASLEVNETVQLSATISPSNATNQNVTYTSSNTSVATVNSTGLVTAVSEGTTNITATTEDGGFTSQATITVTASTSNPPQGNGDCSITYTGNRPNPPCGVWAEIVSSTSVILHWNDNSDNEDYFDIQGQIPGSGFSDAGVSDGLADTNSITLTNLIVGSKYTFRIRSTNSSGTSSWVVADQIDLGTASRIGVTEVVEEKLTIYPIPSNGELTITSSSKGEGKVINMVGQVMKTISWVEGDNNMFFDLNRGIYLLVSDDLKIKKRFIIK